MIESRHTVCEFMVTWFLCPVHSEVALKVSIWEIDGVGHQSNLKVNSRNFFNFESVTINQHTNFINNSFWRSEV